MKVVINKCYGVYSLSPKALRWLWDRGYRDNATPIDEYFGGDNAQKEKRLAEWNAWNEDPGNSSIFVTVFSPCGKFVLSSRPENRADLMLIECVETLGDEASGDLAELKVVEIPDGTDWQIGEYDGREWVEETHETWG